MAIDEHVELLRQGSEIWNAWRKKNSRIEVDLSNVDLKVADLSDANLDGANLNHTNLSYANLAGADLDDADLIGADLSFARLRGAHLIGANLHRANLYSVELRDADLIRTDFTLSDLRNVDFNMAYFSNADLSGANLSDADLSDAHFSDVDLTGAQFYKTRVAYTLFAGIDLSAVNGLDTIIHDGPSYVDVKTMRFPEGEARTHFLRGVGFSDAFIDYLPSLLTFAIQYESCFISYAHQDEPLAQRLYKDLQDKGVRCWFAPHDLRPGELFHRGIEDAIHVHEVVLLLLSEHAVQSNWVAHEVETTLGRQAREGRDILFPIRLDDVILHTTEKWAARLCESRHIGDFTDWQDEKVYRQRFEELLHHLKVKST